MCSSLLQLAHGSHDLFHAEKRITVCKAEQIHKMTTISLLMFIQDNFECHFVILLGFTQKLFSYQLEINHVIQEPTETI